MNDERIKKLEKELSDIEAEIERRKEGLKTAKESFDNKLVELRAEIKRNDHQQEMAFGQPKDGKKVDEAQFEVVDEKPKQLNGPNPLTLPEHAGGNGDAS